MNQQSMVDDNLVPLIGEFAWHSLVEDPRIEDESKRHFDLVMNVLKNYNFFKPEQLHILEIACYAHTTGYQLKEKLNAQVTLFELSRHALQTGKRISKTDIKDDNPMLVSGDFHHLPFEDNSFNVVFICSALHHTWRYQDVLKEMIRVLAPGGILFFENEPTNRELCFYKFRCNRVHEFTNLETKLDELGILRTVAEPFLGSRPEMLFGMVENQNIPLMDILNRVTARCDLLETNVFPESCMGVLEKFWFDTRHIGADELEKIIVRDLTLRCHQAVEVMGEAEQGLEFSLPDDKEIQEIAALVSSKLTQIPLNHELLDYRLKLSEVFGAPLQLTARKRFTPDQIRENIFDPEAAQQSHEAMFIKRNHFKKSSFQFEDVYNSFPKEIREVLGQTSVLPDIQTSPLKILMDYFPKNEWTTTQGDFELIALENLEHQLVSLINKQNIASVLLPLEKCKSGSYLFIIRIYCQVQDNQYYKISLTLGQKTIYEYPVYQSENVLCKHILSADLIQRTQGKIEMIIEPINPEHQDHGSHFAVSYAGLFQVEALVNKTIY